MADTQNDDRVSKEAHERVTRERDELKTQLAAASKALNDFTLRDKAYEHFSRQEGVADPFGVANAAMRDVTLKDTSVDDLAGKLDGWLGEQRKIWGPTTTPVAEPAEPPPVPGSEEAPGFVAPSPGSTGTLTPDLPQVTLAQLQAQYGSGLTNEIIARHDADGSLLLRPEVRAAVDRQRG